MRTLYVTDLDGTLLNSDSRLSFYSRQTLNRLAAQGVLISYATARSLISALPVTQGLRLQLPAVTYNGCALVQPDSGKVLDLQSFTPEEYAFVRGVLGTVGVSPLVYTYLNVKETVLWRPEKENDGVRRYLSLRQGDPRLCPVHTEAALYRGGIFYFTCIGEQKELQPVYDAVSRDGRFACTLQQELYRPEYWCEIMPRQATKANGVLRLKKLCRCSRVVAFGDAVNDLPLFRAADEGYAVANAVPELKQCAVAVLPDNNCDGVAHWLAENAVPPQK